MNGNTVTEEEATFYEVNVDGYDECFNLCHEGNMQQPCGHPVEQHIPKTFFLNFLYMKEG